MMFPQVSPNMVRGREVVKDVVYCLLGVYSVLDAVRRHYCRGYEQHVLYGETSLCDVIGALSLCSQHRCIYSHQYVRTT